MGSLLAMLRASHCHSTHHFFAIDALPLVQTDAGRRLVRCLLRHHGRYLAGAIDPDARFRDFQNHVVHVGDGFWGGAPRVAEQWYGRLQRYLRERRWSDAAHAAGVLSHYFTDPMQPLHTGFCHRQELLHRVIETGIRSSYRDLYRQWSEDRTRIVFQLGDQHGWLTEAILRSARLANRSYVRLLDGFQVDRADADPQAGLSPEARLHVSDLIGLAVTGLARVLERAAAEAEAASGQPLPSFTLAWPLLWTMLRVPDRALRDRRRERRDLRELRASLAAYRATGDASLLSCPEVELVGRVLQVVHQERQRREMKTANAAVHQKAPRRIVDTLAGRGMLDRFQTRNSASVRLDPNAPIVDAPSLSRRHAERLNSVGIRTVADLIAAEPERIATRLDTPWVDEAKVRKWQLQSRLVSRLPGLTARDAKLLIGVGYTDPEQLLGSDARLVHRAIARFALTRSGRLALGGTKPPELAHVERWLAADAGAESEVAPGRRAA